MNGLLRKCLRICSTSWQPGTELRVSRSRRIQGHMTPLRLRRGICMPCAFGIYKKGASPPMLEFSNRVAAGSRLS